MGWRQVAIGVAVVVLGSASGCSGSDSGPDGPFEWEQVGFDYGLESVVALGDGFVGQAITQASGTVNDPSELTYIFGIPYVVSVITSPDGVKWSEVDVPVLQPDELVQWRDGGPHGAVGIVTSPNAGSPVPDLLFTADGVEWVRGQLPPEVIGPEPTGFGPDSYAVGAAGVMAAFTVEGEQGPQAEVLLSTDLQQWQRLDHPWSVSAEGGLVVAASPEGYLLAETGSGPCVAPVVGYVSVDGQAWEPITSTEEYVIAGGGGERATGWRGGFAVSAATFPDSAGEGQQPQSQIWLSAEDRTWAEVDMSALSGDMVGIRDGSTLGLLAAGETRPEPGQTQDAYLMFSTDGTAWGTFSARDTFGGELGDAVMGERSLLVSSFDPEGGEAGAQWWLGTPAEG